MIFYADDRLTLLLGDARDQLAEIEPGTVQAIVTSPPYWGLRDYGTAEWEGGDESCDHGAVTRDTGRRSTLAGGRDWQGKASVQAARERCGKCGARRLDRQIGMEATAGEYVAALAEVFAAARETLTDTGTLWLNVGDSYGDELLGIPWQIAEALRADGWRLIRDVVWAKTNAMPESADSRPSTAHEYVFMLAKGRRHFYAHRTDKHQRSVWAGATAGYGEAHFAVMPDWLAQRCVLLGSRREDVILDPFAGAGTTLCQALDLGRRAAGVELSEENCAMILRRAGLAEVVEL